MYYIYIKNKMYKRLQNLDENLVYSFATLKGDALILVILKKIFLQILHNCFSLQNQSFMMFIYT